MSYYTDHGEVLYQIRLNVSDDFTDNDVLNELLENQPDSLSECMNRAETCSEIHDCILNVEDEADAETNEETDIN